MLVTLGVALALSFQGAQAGPSHRNKPVVRDSVADSTTLESRRGRHDRHEGRRAPVTAQTLATAFKDPAAKRLLLEARASRLRVDSTLDAYDAKAYQRISVGMGFGRIGRDRLLFRHESSMRVRWQRNVGAWVDVTGNRTAIPIAEGNAGVKADIKNDPDLSGNDPDLGAEIPYYPGYEPLWIGNNIAKAQVDETELVNPVAEGAEAYYTYATGDSIGLRLPNGRTIQLRELKVRPRQPKWNLGVGSLWFDTQSGQLVRAAYRLSVPMDIWAVATEEDSTSMDDVPVWVKPLITPMKAQVSAIEIEYGLFEGRFWLPRFRRAEGDATVSFMHIPFKIEESFNYASVNAKDTLPQIQIAESTRPQPPDSLSEEQRDAWRDSVREVRRVARRAEADSIRRGLKAKVKRVAQCDTADSRMSAGTRYEGALRVAVRVPCDVSKLEHSPDLPGSIYDSNDELFGGKELAALQADALSMAAQAPLEFRLSALPPATVSYGPSMMRYNRVEGLSLGASIEQQVGGGYSASAVGRFGFADHEPNVELNVTRTNLRKSIGVTAYNRLVSASDWGHPLSFGSSFSALLFGRDEGFYYRATGVELSGSRDAPFGGGMQLAWRIFGEQERNAAVNTNFAINGADFPANLVARRGGYGGVGARITHDYGLDPNGLRVSSDLRLEAAAGDSAYGRGALDVTISHGLGALAGALTLSGGSSIGGLPPQRLWYLGGSQTVRGQSPDTAQSGNAFWLTRAELGSSSVGMRPTIFADLGWVGDRSKLSEVGRPMSGVGAGVSFLDGLFRFDVARGLYPRKQFRVDLYLESKF